MGGREASPPRSLPLPVSTVKEITRMAIRAMFIVLTEICLTFVLATHSPIHVPGTHSQGLYKYILTQTLP